MKNANPLDPVVLLNLLREERGKQLARLRESIDVNVNVDGASKKVVTPGLKLRSKPDGLLYTVKAVSTSGAVLTDPNGRDVVVDDKQLAGFDLD